jgi:hypothetical protein
LIRRLVEAAPFRLLNRFNRILVWTPKTIKRELRMTARRDN